MTYSEDKTMEDFFERLDAYLKEKHALDKAESSYEGYEFGYHYGSEIDRVKRLRVEAKQELKNLIVEIIKEEKEKEVDSIP